MPGLNQPPRGRPWRRTVARVIRRDGGICHICGRPDADSADHIVPRSQGGPDTMDNLRAVHHKVAPHCNMIRGDRSIEHARTEIVRRTQPTTTDWTW